jgi:GT2 family glycosyltransferase
MRGISLRKRLVSIIIVTRNSAATLRACLASIQDQRYTDYEIILVDNGSTDDTLSLANPQTVTLLANPRNLGFAKANNQGLEIAEGEFVLFLNSDATISPDYLALLIPYFSRDSNLGALAGKLLRSPSGGTRIIDSAGLHMEHWRLLPRDRGEGEIDRGQYDKTASVFGAPGACALYRRSALNGAALGQEVMDEDFFAYYEDVDLAWRIRQQNRTAVYVPDAIAFHHKKGPQLKESFIQTKAFTNRYWCYIKNERIPSFLSYAFLAIPYEILRVLKALTLHPSWIPAYVGEWKLLGKMLKKRSAIHRLMNENRKT